jgi:non-specific serine/threonine protein kinase
MITSRALLQLRGEHEFSVPAMETPAPSPTAPPAQLSKAESIQLFVARARAANASFELTPENAPAIAEIVVRLDGLPLAIELAAARSKLLPPQAMLKRLSSRLEVLTGGARDAPARQQTLRNALDWDYDLLNEAEQRLFRRLAVFAGGFTIESALDVTWTGADDLELLELLDSLVVKSLLHRSETRSDEVRFESLKTIREYQYDKLDEAGEQERTVECFTEHFLKIAESGNSLTIGPEQVEWLEKLEREHDNLRAVLRWAADSDDSETFYRLCAALGPLWELRSYLSEGQYWYGLALSRKADVPSDLRAKALHGAGVLARGQGDLKRAREYLEEAIRLRRELGDELMLGVSLKHLGNVYIDMGDRTKARDLYDESLYIRRALGDVQGIAELLNNLGVLARFDERYEDALGFYAEALQLFDQVYDEPGAARLYMNMAEANLELGNFTEASRHCKKCMEMFLEMGSRWDMADCLEILATIASRRGDPVDAARLFGSAEALRELLKTPLPPAERATYDKRVVETRTLLDGTTFAVEWAKGRAMTYDETVDYALQI